MSFFRFVFKILKSLTTLIGYDLRVARIGVVGESYETIAPVAKYAPWGVDAKFIEIFKIIKEYTLVDKYKCYGLWQLVKESSKLEGALIEIGVWRGGSGCLIAKQAELMGIKDTVYLCDTFSGVVKAGSNDSTYKGGEHADTSEKIVEGVVKKLNLQNVKVLSGIFPDETGDGVSESKFRFCHIDVDVYQSAKDILEWIWSKMVIGGVIVFDDYASNACEGITKLVNEERNKKDRLFIYNLNGHGILIKI